jgi:hypothetical protein
MIVTVYHRITPTFMDNDVRELERTFPIGFNPVARVEVRDIHETYQVTNHIDGNWLMNPEVVDRFQVAARSTSVGDVFVVEGTKEGWSVNSIGLADFKVSCP